MVQLSDAVEVAPKGTARWVDLPVSLGRRVEGADAGACGMKACPTGFEHGEHEDR